MRPITDILREYRNGRAVDLASAQFQELSRAVSDVGKKGKITIELTLSPADDGSAERSLQIKIKSSIPQAELPPAIFYADSAGDLHRSDPAQREMFKEAGDGRSRADA